MSIERERNLNVRISDDELAKLHRLADDRDVTASTLLRHVIRDLYLQRFGSEPASAARRTRRVR